MFCSRIWVRWCVRAFAVGFATLCIGEPSHAGSIFQLVQDADSRAIPADFCRSNWMPCQSYCPDNRFREGSDSLRPGSGDGPTMEMAHFLDFWAHPSQAHLITRFEGLKEPGSPEYIMPAMAHVIPLPPALGVGILGLTAVIIGSHRALRKSSPA